MGLADVLSRLFNACSLHVRLLFIRLVLFIRQTIEYRTAPGGSTSRTVLLLGDAVALGVGDILGGVGLTSRLPGLLREGREDSGLRLYWHVVTAGVLRATAKDWAPGAARRLFENALIRGPFRKAEVVIVLLGAHDDLVNEGKETAEAVARIAEGVVRLGKHCVVANFGNEYPVRSPEHGKVREANEMLRRGLEKVNQENNAPGCGSVSWDVEMAKVFALGNDVLAFENDFITPNASGYRLLAREVYDAFVPAAKKVEWAHWKQKLSSR